MVKHFKLKEILRACVAVILTSTLVLSLLLFFQGCAARSSADRKAVRGTTRRTVRRMERRDERRDERPPQPGNDYWWNGKEWLKLPPAPKDTVWVPGHYNPDDVWVPGHFKYVGPVPKGQVWVTGHWEGNTWVPGHFRPAVRTGFVWVPGHYDRNGRWVEGHWQAVR